MLATFKNIDIECTMNMLQAQIQASGTEIHFSDKFKVQRISLVMLLGIN